MNQSEKQLLFIKKYNHQKRKIRTIQLSLILFFILSWELLTRYQIINAFVYSSPTKIIITLKELIIRFSLFKHILVTFEEIMISFFLGVSLGTIIATIFYEYPLIYKIFEPFFSILNALPKVSLGPIIIIIFGANIKSIIIMALLINLIVSVMTIYNGFSNIDNNKIKLFKTFKATKKQTLYKLIIPSSYITIISSLKLTMSLTLIGVITGEFLVSKNGLGYLIIYGTQIFNLDIVMTSVFVIIIISFVLYKFIIYLEKKLIKNID